MFGNSNSNFQGMRIGDQLKSNQSITISDHQFSENANATASFATQSLPKDDQNKLSHKYLLLCTEIQRLSKLAQKQHTQIYNLKQQLQINKTDIEGFRVREQILQQELKKLQTQDKDLLSANHKLQQMLLEKNRLTSVLQQQLLMFQSKTSIGPKDTQNHKTLKIKQLQQLVGNQKSKNTELERQLKQAALTAQRAISRDNSRRQNEKTLILNAQKKILDLQEQLRKYIAQKQKLQQNELRFRQQQINLQTTKTFEFTKQVELLEGLNSNLLNEKQKTTDKVVQLQKQLSQAHLIMKTKLTQQDNNHLKQKTVFETKINTLNTIIAEKQILISQLNLSKSDLQYKLQTTINDLKRIQGLYNQLQQQNCQSCVAFDKENTVLNNKIKWLQELMQSKQKQYKLIILKSEKQLKNLKQLLQSVNNLKGSNQRVSRLIESSTQKLIKVSTSNKRFQSSSNLN